RETETIGARRRPNFATQHLGHQRTGMCNCASDGARRVKSRFGYCRRVWTLSSSMNCRAYGARERCGSQAVTFQRPIEAPRWTSGTVWTFPRGIRTLDGITATPYPAVAKAIRV